MPKSGDVQFRHPVSLYKRYGLKNADDKPQLAGRAVRAVGGGRPRAALSLNYFERLRERIARKFDDFRAKRGNLVKRWRSASGDDRVQSQRFVRFNARHKQFSSRMESVVSRLKTSNSNLDDRDGTLKTLRNDMRMMRRENPRATKFTSLKSRLDVELSKLSDVELKNFVDNVTHERDKLAGHTMSAQRHGADLRVLNKMLVVALRHQIARSPKMDSLLGDINTQQPEDITDGMDLLKNADALHLTMKLSLQTKSGDALSDQELSGDLDALATEFLRDAVRLRLQRDNPGDRVLASMNRNLLNVAHGLRESIADIARKNHLRLREQDVQIATFSAPLRALNRAVRHEYLSSLASQSGFSDEHAVSRFRELGHGAAHCVQKVTYKRNSFQTTKVYKGDDETLMHFVRCVDPYGHSDQTCVGFVAPSAIGLDQSSPRLLERAVAASRFDELLGFGLTVKTDFAVHEDQLGIVMDLAPGKPAKDRDQMRRAIAANRGELQLQLALKQLFDTLLGGSDPNRGNYMIYVDGSFVLIQSIDQDYLLGPNPTDPRDIVGVGNLHVSLPALPPVIDMDMRRVMKDLTDADIDRIMEGLFSDAAIAAAKSRMRVLKQHYQNLSDQGAVIHPHEWGSKETEELLRDEDRLKRGVMAKIRKLRRQQAKFPSHIKRRQSDLEQLLIRYKVKDLYEKRMSHPDGFESFLRALPGRGVHRNHCNLILRAMNRLLEATDAQRTCHRTQTKLQTMHDSVGQLALEIRLRKGQIGQADRVCSLEQQFKDTLRQMHELSNTPYSSYWQRDSLNV